MKYVQLVVERSFFSVSNTNNKNGDYTAPQRIKKYPWTMIYHCGAFFTNFELERNNFDLLTRVNISNYSDHSYIKLLYILLD